MTGPYLLVVPFLALALLLLVVAWTRTLVFFRHQSAAGALGFAPAESVRLWLRLFRRNGFGAAAEPLRRRVVRFYGMALAAGAVAAVVYAVLPAMPG